MALEVELNNIQTTVKDCYQDQCDSLVSEEKRNIIVSHYGGFSLDLISNLSDSVQQLLVSKGDNAAVRKRMFSILIEGMQNVRRYGARDGKGAQGGEVVIAEKEASYKIIISNLVDKQNKELVEEYLKKINAYSIDDLSEKYKSTLQNEFLTKEGGAGLGLMTTRLKTGKKLGYKCFQINEQLELFAFEVVLPRELN